MGVSNDKRLNFITRFANDPTDGERRGYAQVRHSMPNKTRVGTGMSRGVANSLQRFGETAICWLALF